jgi:murein DD-endopeptidase MepM/ murein hydrolase activator NlpD
MSPRLATLALALAALALGGAGQVARAADGRLAPEVTLVALPDPADFLAPAQRAAIEGAIARARRRGEAPRNKEGEASPFPFFPQAGVLGRDLFLNNFTDQDPGRELVRDWDCSDYTYDGHRGHDSLIRSFREQSIGVPIFAVLPGVVVDAHDGEPDTNTAWDPTTKANFVVLDHGGGTTTWYLHMKAGSVAVAEGQPVAAGTQLGLTGSSGISNWPHLHFETHQGGGWVEPSAGPCREGASLWADQPPVDRELWLADVYLTRGSVEVLDLESYLLDETPRAGRFLPGSQVVGVRADLRNVPAEARYRLRVTDPKGRLVEEREEAFDNRATLHLGVVIAALPLQLTLGTWRLRLDVDGTQLVDAPFAVVASARQLGNRKPNRVTARLAPARPVAGAVMTCTVVTSPATEDPDFDVVGYRYEWRVNNRVVRTVTSAALSDRLGAGVARPQDRVSCKVTPTDGKSSGPPALAVAAAAP